MRLWLLLPPAVFLAVAYVVPLEAILAAADADAWQWVLRHPLVAKTVWQAAVQAVLSTALSLAIAWPLAWSHHRRRVPFGRVQLAIHAAPFVLPVFVVVFGVQAMLGAGGWSQRLLGIDVLGAAGPLGAIIIAHAYYNYGFAARLLHATLERRPHRLEEAARVLGADRVGAMLRTTIPLLLPSMLAIAVLVFLFTFASFGVVIYLGDGWMTLETLLYEQLRGAFPRRDRAAALGVLQLVLNLGLLLAYQFLIRRQARLPREVRDPPVAAARGQILAWAATVAGALPALAVLLGGFQVRGRWSLEPWRLLLDPSRPGPHRPGFDLAHALQMTALYAVAAAAIAIGLTLLLAYGLERMHPWARAVGETLAALPLGTSSLLIGFGILLAYGISAFTDPGRGRLLIIAAHGLVAFPFTARALLPAIQQHDRRLDEAAALLGAPRLGVWWRVHVPLLRAPLAAALGIAMAMSIGDFGASLLLMAPDNRSVSVWIDAYGGVGNFNPLLRAQAVALAGLLMVLAAAAYVLAEAVEVRGVRRRRVPGGVVE